MKHYLLIKLAKFFVFCFFFYFVFIFSAYVQAQSFFWHCGQLSDNAPQSIKKDIDACNSEREACEKKNNDNSLQFSNCIKRGGGCWDIGRSEYLEGPNSCPREGDLNAYFEKTAFKEGNIAYCECIRKCWADYPTSSQDCLNSQNECCKRAFEKNKGDAQTKTEAKKPTNTPAPSEEEIVITLDKPMVDLNADGKSRVFITATVKTKNVDTKKLTFSSKIDRPNTYRPGKIINSQTLNAATYQIEYESPLIYKQEISNANDSIIDYIYIYAQTPNKKEYKSVVINLTANTNMQVKGKVLHIDYQTGYKNATINISIDTKTYTGTTDSAGNYAIPVDSFEGNEKKISAHDGDNREYLRVIRVLNSSKEFQKEIILATTKEYENEAKKRFKQFIGAAGLNTIADKVLSYLSFTYNKEVDLSYKKPNINIPGEEQWTYEENMENLYHELGHAFWSEAQYEKWADNLFFGWVGEDHENVWTATNNGTAFDEGRTHLFYLLAGNYFKTNNIKTITMPVLQTFTYNWDSIIYTTQNFASKFAKKGENIEGVITRFFLDYLGANCVKQPARCLSHINQIHTYYKTDLKYNRPPRSILEMSQAFLGYIWDKKNVTTQQQIAEQEFLIKKLNLHHISHSFPQIIASPDAVFSYSVKTRIGILFSGTVQLIGDDWEYILAADRIIRPHSNFILTVTKNKEVGIELIEGKLELLDNNKKTIAEITTTHIPFVIDGNEISQASSEITKQLHQPFPKTNLDDYQSLQIENNSPLLYKGKLDLITIAFIIIALLFLFKTFQKIIAGNKVMSILFVLITIGSAIFAYYRYFSLDQVGPDYRKSIDTFYEKSESSTSSYASSTVNQLSPTKLEDDPNNLDTSDVTGDSIQYYNCKYHYTFHYAVNWTNNANKESNKALFQGEKIKVVIEAFPKKQSSLENFASFMNKKISSTLSTETKTDLYGGNLIEVRFDNPAAVARYWEEGDNYMQLLATNIETEFDKNDLDSILVTFSINNDQISYCQEEECSHPNGDVEYWWKNASEDVKQCYIKKYGITPSL